MSEMNDKQFDALHAVESAFNQTWQHVHLFLFDDPQREAMQKLEKIVYAAIDVIREEEMGKAAGLLEALDDVLTFGAHAEGVEERAEAAIKKARGDK